MPRSNKQTSKKAYIKKKETKRKDYLLLCREIDKRPMSTDNWSKNYDNAYIARIHKKSKRELNKAKEDQGYGICEKCGKRDVSIENELINITSRKGTSSVPPHIWYCPKCNNEYHGIVE